MVKVYGDEAPSYSTVKRWAAQFQHGRKCLEDDPWSGRPPKAVNENIIKFVEKLVIADGRITVEKIVEETGISHGCVGNILQKHLKVQEVFACWVPKMPTADTMSERAEISKENLQFTN